MIGLLKPLQITHNYETKQLNFMIDKNINPVLITEDEYTILRTQCKKYDTDILIDEDNKMFTLVFIENNKKKSHYVGQLSESFYKNIMKRTVQH